MASSGASGSRQHGVNGQRGTGTHDLPKAFDHVAYQKPIDAGARTHFPMMQLKLLLPLYQAARHVELDGVAGEALQARRGVIPG